VFFIYDNTGVQKSNLHGDVLFPLWGSVRLLVGNNKEEYMKELNKKQLASLAKYLYETSWR